MKKTIALMGILMMTMSSINAQDKKAAATDKSRIVEVSTDYGKMKIRLYDETPQHRDNFIKLASKGFYDGLLFHRVIKGFMIQGGDPESKDAPAEKMLGSGDVGYKVPAEFNDNLYHKKGTLCAARDGNPEKASSGCQFYIVQGKKYTDEELNMMEARSGMKYTEQQRNDYKTIGGTPMLDKNYTVYGEVIEGMDVIDKIASVKTRPGDRPESDVKMTVKVIR
jgi:cyclophilin family peptidyl-prolyl cis-trans isomerase